jgi:uncharacterized membrane protein
MALLNAALLSRGLLAGVATTGAVAAGVVLFEAAIIPGLVIGAAAVLAPEFLPRRRGAKRAATVVGEATPEEPAPKSSWRDMLPRSLGDLAHIKFSRSVVKTITFRVIVTSLDFAGNYLVLGEATTAAGLSAINVVGGPLFYFIHESTWNYLAGAGKVDALAKRRGLNFLNNHPLAKTITYRTFATIVEFTTNYVVVGDVATAALLSSFGFFLGPIVYYGHERLWEGPGSSADLGTPRRPRARPMPVIIDVEPAAV